MTPRHQRSSYTPEFRAEAVRQVIDTSRPIVEVARELGVYDQTLSTWVSRHKAEQIDDDSPLSDPGSTAVMPEVLIGAL